MLYLLPWQGQSMVPSEIVLTVQPIWVQTALKALYSPFVGWVTTTSLAGKIMPPPTGIVLVAVSAPDALAAAADAVADVPPLAPQAVIAPARPTRPTPASMPRRVASDSLCASCVTDAPLYRHKT
jgi:hypothetical protein